MKSFLCCFILTVFAFGCTKKEPSEIPITNYKYWQIQANYPRNYEIGMTKDYYEGKQVYYIKPIVKVTDDFGSMDRVAGSLDEFRLRKAKLSCNIKTENLDDKARLHIGIINLGTSLIYGKSIDIRENHDWKKYEIPVDFPDYTFTRYGVAIFGNGRVLFSNLELKFEEGQKPWP